MHFFLCKGRCHEFLFSFSVFETLLVWDISQFEMFDDELVLFQKKSYFSITVLQRTMRIRIQINEKYAENTYKNIINLLKQNYWWKIHAHLFVAEDWGKPTKKCFVCMVSPVKFDIISVLIHKDRQKVFFLFRKKVTNPKHLNYWHTNKHSSMLVSSSLV